MVQGSRWRGSSSSRERALVPGAIWNKAVVPFYQVMQKHERVFGLLLHFHERVFASPIHFHERVLVAGLAVIRVIRSVLPQLEKVFKTAISNLEKNAPRSTCETRKSVKSRGCRRFSHGRTTCSSTRRTSTTTVRCPACWYSWRGCWCTRGGRRLRGRRFAGSVLHLSNGGPCVLNGPFRADFRACFGPFSTHGLTNVQNGPFWRPAGKEDPLR